MERKKFSLIVPVFNSSTSLTELFFRISKVFNDLGKSFEVIFIDDASSNPDTWSTLSQLSRHPEVTAIRFTRNFGKQSALICGFTYARGQWIITMDDDLQHLPEHFPALIGQSEHDVVIASFEKKEHSLLKRVLSFLNDRVETLLLNKPVSIRNSPFKLIKRQVVDAFLQIKTPYPSISALVFYVTDDIVNVVVSHGKRSYGKTGFTPKKMFRTFSNLLFNNSSFLLKSISAIGILISLPAFVIGLYFLLKKMTVGIPVPGYTSLMVVVSFLGGLILFSIGITGEYLVRIINGIEHKPPFIIKTIVGKPGDL